MKDPTFWGIYFVIAILWTAANLWLYYKRTQPGQELGLSGSLSIWIWDVYMVCGIVAGVTYKPFGFQLAAGWRILGLLAIRRGVISRLCRGMCLDGPHIGSRHHETTMCKRLCAI